MIPRASFSPLVSLEQLHGIEEAAIRILETAGLEITNDWLVTRLASIGFPSDAAGRFRIPRAETRRFMEEARRRHDARRPLETKDPRRGAGR